MTCPFCPLVAQVEQPMLAHILRRHPEAAAACSLALTLGAIVLRKRPELLLSYYAVVFVAALAMAGERH